MDIRFNAYKKFLKWTIFIHLMVDFHPKTICIYYMYQRKLTPIILEALSDTPAVFITGARQAGKSTLAKSLAKHGFSAEYYTLDNQGTLAAVANDPQGFIAGLSNSVIIDEVQLVPTLFSAIKSSIDNNRCPGKFLLTGSSNVNVLPTISESLAGRIEVHNLWPLSVGEINNKKEVFIDKLFYEKFTFKDKIKSVQILDKVFEGGYPEPIQRERVRRKQAWFRSYISTIIQRDIRQLANIEGLTHIPEILQILANRSASLVNFADISRTLGIPQTSLKRYMTLLEATFLVYRLKPWSKNLDKRVFKTPKIYLNDTGLLCFLLGVDRQRLYDEPTLAGHILENFVINELSKQISWNETQPKLYHFRTHSGVEVDAVLEDNRGRCVAIEIKNSATVGFKHIKGIKFLQDTLKNKFHRGILLYRGEQIIPFDKNIHALPIDAMWSKHSSK